MYRRWIDRNLWIRAIAKWSGTTMVEAHRPLSYWQKLLLARSRCRDISSQILQHLVVSAQEVLISANSSRATKKRLYRIRMPSLPHLLAKIISLRRLAISDRQLWWRIQMNSVSLIIDQNAQSRNRGLTSQISALPSIHSHIQTSSRIQVSRKGWLRPQTPHALPFPQTIAPRRITSPATPHNSQETN